MLIRSAPQLSSHGVQQYWTASKCRLDRWARNLKSFAADTSQLDASAVRAQWPFVRGVLEEILTGEVLTRVWTAVLCLYDRQHGGNEFESLARSIMIGHMEARLAVPHQKSQPAHFRRHHRRADAHCFSKCYAIGFNESWEHNSRSVPQLRDDLFGVEWAKPIHGAN